MAHLIRTLLILFAVASISSSALAGDFDAKEDTLQWLPVIMISSVDNLPDTTVLYTDVTVTYKKNGTVTWSTFSLLAADCTLTSGDWCNEDSTDAPGHYSIGFSASELDTAGDFTYVVRGTDLIQYNGRFTIKVLTEDEESIKFDRKLR